MRAAMLRLLTAACGMCETSRKVRSMVAVGGEKRTLAGPIMQANF
jgi:hypothetical protein